jgi:PASTA domain
MTQPPYGPPPQGPSVPGPVPGQPPYGPPPGAPGYPQGQYGATPAYPQPVPPANNPFYKRPWFMVVAGLVVVGAIGSALGGDPEETSSSAAATTTVTATVPAETETPAAVAPAPEAVIPPAATTSAAPVVDFAMPDFVGMDLQSAQDLLQANGVWVSISHDLLGSRNQMLDSNWIVCDQNIPAGQRVTGDVEGQVDFGAVKRDEVCP